MSLNYKIDKHILNITVEGKFVSYNNDKEINNLLNTIQNNIYIKEIKTDTSGLLKWDSSLLVILYEIEKISQNKKIIFDKTTLPDGLQRLLKLAFSSTRKLNIKNENTKISFFEKIGDIEMALQHLVLYSS